MDLHHSFFIKIDTRMIDTRIKHFVDCTHHTAYPLSPHLQVLCQPLQQSFCKFGALAGELGKVMMLVFFSTENFFSPGDAKGNVSDRVRSAKVEDFVMGLCDLHQQFHWPFPILSPSAFHQLRQNLAGVS